MRSQPQTRWVVDSVLPWIRIGSLTGCQGRIAQLGSQKSHERLLVGPDCETSKGMPGNSLKQADTIIVPAKRVGSAA